MVRWEPTTRTRRTLDSNFAKWYLSLPGLPSEREIQKDHVEKLKARMLNGMMLEDNVSVATIGVNGKTYKGNGQHTCTARNEPNGDAPNLKINYCHYDVASLADAAQLYAQFDPSWGGRRFPHIAGAIWSTDGMLKKFGSKRFLSLAAGAIAFDKMGRTFRAKQQLTGDDRINLPKQHTKAVEILQQITEEESHHLMRDAVFCAMYQTIRVDAEAALRFWSDVRDGAMLEKDDPRKRLEVYLRRIVSNMGPGSTKAANVNRKPGNNELYTKCIHFWNAWREGRTTDAKWYPSAPLPTAR